MRRHLNTLYITIDGNFKLYMYRKNNNQSEKSLWNGAGVMSRQDEVDAHVRAHGNVRIEVRSRFDGLRLRLTGKIRKGNAANSKR